MIDDSAKTMENSIAEHLQKASAAGRRLVHLGDKEIAGAILELADLTQAYKGYILTENKKDLERMDPADPKYDRLLLNEKRIEAIVADLRKVAALPSPLNIELEKRTLPNGLRLSRVTVPLGVVGIVYESRPNVTFDVFALCFKSGNAVVLKGSRDAHFSNIAIVDLIHRVLKKRDLEDACYLAPSEREALPHILNADKYVDIIIPRGGQGLIDFVRKHSRVPVIETGAGIVHTYFDKSGDLEKGKQIIENAKARRVSVCNALDSLVIHKDRLGDLPDLLRNLGESHRCRVFADERAFRALEGRYDRELLQPAKEEDFGTEFLAMKMSVKTVDDMEDALEHIARYSSKHSEAIVAEDTAVIDYFLHSVDAAVVYANTSTAFTDGAEFGLGAEIGISTQKLHARGPMGLRELTSYKWVVRGEGQVRE
jgi:glutamate-5-semialdehyde dehydrogenase